MKVALWVTCCLGLLVGMAPASAVVLEPGAALDAEPMPAFGINLGGASYWGAEQLRANIVRNPGFEPVLERSLVLVDHENSGKIVDRDPWASRPDSLWTGGRYQVLSGPWAGKTGVIRDYQRQDGQAGQFWFDPPLPGVATGTAISVEKTGRLNPVPQWWSEGRTSLVKLDRGGYAARLLPQTGIPARLNSFFDTLGGKAGRLLPVSGEWMLKIRVRAQSGQLALHVRFARDGTKPLLQETVTPTAVWQTLVWHFQGQEDWRAQGAPLSLSLQAEGEGEIWVDDVYLGEAKPAAGGFRQVVLANLRQLAPGYVREWQGQLGDRVSNRFADELQRQPIRYRPGEAESFFAYSIPEFFALCQAVKAKPWVIGPPTLSASEWREFAAGLRREAERYQLDEVVLEFGNENWNALFRPAGLTDVRVHREAVERAFAAARQGFGSGRRLLTVVNAPFLWPDSPGPIMAATQVDRVAVAPYFLYELPAGLAQDNVRQRALRSQQGPLLIQQARVRALGKRLSIYEMNFHTTLGNAPATERNTLLAGSLAGVALARQLLEARLAGVRELAVYSLAGFSYRLEGGLGDIALFGVSRDLSVPGRWRPTGLALSLLNELGGGQVWGMRCTGGGCQDLIAMGVATRPGDKPRGLAMLNSGSEVLLVETACHAGDQLSWLDGRSHGDNETAAMPVQIQRAVVTCQRGRTRLRIPPESVLVMRPGG